MLEITIIGTGHIASAISKLHKEYHASVNYNLNILTGCAENIGKQLFGFEVQMFDQRICHNSDIIILAIPENKILSFVEKNRSCFNKILIDCSNKIGNGVNVAQVLSDTTCSVVKAFTSINVFQILDERFSIVKSPEFMTIAGNDQNALNLVKNYLDKIGFIARDIPCIEASRAMEAANFRNFSNWHSSILTSIVLSCFFVSYAIVERNVAHDRAWYEQSIKNINTAVCCTAITLFATVYGIGAAARIKQSVLNRALSLKNDLYLVSFLNRRKQIGLVAVVNLSLHVVISLLLFGSSYFQYFSKDSNLTHAANVSLLCGIVGYFGYLLISLTSLPSIAKELGMTEWRTVQSYIGWSSLIFAMGHVVAMGYNDMLSETKWGFSLPSLFMITTILPAIATVTKLISMVICCPQNKTTRDSVVLRPTRFMASNAQHDRDPEAAINNEISPLLQAR